MSNKPLLKLIDDTVSLEIHDLNSGAQFHIRNPSIDDRRIAEIIVHRVNNWKE